MALTTPSMGLRVWNDPNDPYDHDQLADNLAKIDFHDHAPGRGQPISTEGVLDGSITANKMAAGVLAGVVGTGGISEIKLATNAVSTRTIQDVAVTNAKLAPLVVTTPKIADGAIVNAKLGNGSVTELKISSGAVLDGHIHASAAIAESKLVLASDAASNIPSRRTLGGGSQQAAAGNDIRLSNQRPPQSPEANLKVVRGTVNAAGTVLGGDGFSIVRNGLGDFTINFAAPAFAGAPSVTISPIYLGSGSGLQTILNGLPSSNAAQITTYSTTLNAYIDIAFGFIAIGPAG